MSLAAEQHAINEVIAYGRAYGFGNMIDRLKIAWVLQYIEIGLSWEAACVGAGLNEQRTKNIVKAANTNEGLLLIKLRDYIGEGL